MNKLLSLSLSHFLISEIGEEGIEYLVDEGVVIIAGALGLRIQ